MNDWTNLADALRIGGWVIWPLSALAVVALAIVLDLMYTLWRFARMPAGALNPSTQHAAHVAASLPRHHALSRLSRVFEDNGVPLWRIESRAESQAARIERDMSRGLWLLETIVTAAPLVGMLGTIVGMMHSFRLIGGDGPVNPARVSGGVAQALVATAIGLVIALVALFAFNYFSRRVDHLMDELESFANENLGALRLAREQPGMPS